MSTHLATVRGTESTVDPAQGAVDFSSFYGGARRGPCLQVTIGGEYVQLDVAGAAYARDVLDSFLREHGVGA